MAGEKHTFICYARQDKDFAMKLANDLRTNGVKIWIDQLDIPAGVRWDRAVQRALHNCERLLVILSPDAVDSENVLDELAFAFDRKKPIVPVLFRRCEIPFRLLRLQYLDFTGNDDPALHRLLRSLGVQPPARKPAIRQEVETGMVLIPAGSFIMGTSEKQIEALLQKHSDWQRSWFEDEKPEHRVEVDAFYLDTHEVTVEKYLAFLEANPNHRNPAEWADQLKEPKRPVVYVSWQDAKAYAGWAGKKLPTEAQWEYAARGGDTGVAGKPSYTYPWGNDADTQKANFDHDNSRSYSWENAKRYLKDAGRYAPNGYGLYDMAGNVWEWCADWHDIDYYRKYAGKIAGNPEGPKTGELRVLRGGSWDLNPINLRCASRNSSTPTSWSSIVGFRCSQDVF